MTLSKLQFSDDKVYLVIVKNCNGDKKTVKATKMIIISTDLVLVCI